MDTGQSMQAEDLGYRGTQVGAGPVFRDEHGGGGVVGVRLEKSRVRSYRAPKARVRILAFILSETEVALKGFHQQSVMCRLSFRNVHFPG